MTGSWVTITSTHEIKYVLAGDQVVQTEVLDTDGQLRGLPQFSCGLAVYVSP